MFLNAIDHVEEDVLRLSQSIGIYILAEGHFLKKPYRSNLNEVSS